MYGFIDRQNLPGLFRTFDFASPDAHTPRTPHTIVPQQALYLMNSPFAIEQAEHLARRSETPAATAPEQRVAALFRYALGREPQADESKWAVEFVNASAGRWERLAQVLLMSNELAYVD